MPISGYFKGSGDKVMDSMQKEYGADKGKSVFYATANKQKMTPPKALSQKPKKFAGNAHPKRFGGM